MEFPVVWPHTRTVHGLEHDLFFFFDPPPLPPSLIQTFRYASGAWVKLNLMHRSITEQKYVLLAFILGYMLVLHYPSWVLKWVTELAVWWGKPDVYSKKTIVLGPELSLKSASNSHSIILSLFSLKKKKIIESCSKTRLKNPNDDRKVWTRMQMRSGYGFTKQRPLAGPEAQLVAKRLAVWETLL